MRGSRVRTLPYAPASRIDDTAHDGVLEADASIFRPRAAEVDASGSDGGGLCGGDGGFIDYVVGDIGGGGAAAGGDGLAAGCDADVRAVNPGAGVLAEDEIDSAFYVTFGVDLIAGLAEECVLIAVKSYAVVSLFITVGAQGEGLRPTA